MAPEIVPELKVVFPMVERIGIATAVIADVSDSIKTDTTAVAMVKVRGHFSSAERKKLKD